MNCDKCISNLKENEKLVLFVISRIPKTSDSCFPKRKLQSKHQIKKNNVDTECILNNLVNKGLLYKGHKKDIWCVTHCGKLLEHMIETEKLKGKSYKVIRNKSNL